MEGDRSEKEDCMSRRVIIALAIAGLLVSAADTQSANLESPAAGATLSGIGFISGWKCDAGNITVRIDGGTALSVAMHQPRADTRSKCGGATNNGFIIQMNWTLLGDGVHEAVAYDDGVEFDRATFRVASTGEEFLSETQRWTIIENFPVKEEDTLLGWNESTQHFEILTVWESGVKTVYDREWWQQYNEDQADGTYTTREFLYDRAPDIDACREGRLSEDARNRAFAAVNHIRQLHGLPVLHYSDHSNQQVQEAALIQAANDHVGHRPTPEVKCYTTVGAEGSRTSNLWRFRSGVDGSGVDMDPARYMVSITNDKYNAGVVEAAGHRRWVLNPFTVYFSYGQVEGSAAQKVFDFPQEPAHLPDIAPDFVAFPFEVYPFNLVEGDPPWSFSVVQDKTNYTSNRGDYFREATITVTRLADEQTMQISNRYTDTEWRGLPNFLSWQVEGWEYDTLYEVEIAGVLLQSGETRDYVYPVLIEREGIE